MQVSYLCKCYKAVYIYTFSDGTIKMTQSNIFHSLKNVLNTYKAKEKKRWSMHVATK